MYICVCVCVAWGWVVLNKWFSAFGTVFTGLLLVLS